MIAYLFMVLYMEFGQAISSDIVSIQRLAHDVAKLAHSILLQMHTAFQ